MIAETVQIGTHRTRRSGARVVKAVHGLRMAERVPRIAPVRSFAGADIGVNVMLPGVAMGREAIVGAGAVLRKDVPDFATVAGVPGRVIGRRKP
jgi:acetyltransferase-like isoleucine patch superfamily enzyme